MTSRVQPSVSRLRSPLCLRGCPELRRLKRSGCRARAQPASLYSVIGGLPLPLGDLSRRTIQNGGSRQQDLPSQSKSAALNSEYKQDYIAIFILIGFMLARSLFAFNIGLGVDESYTIGI